MWRTDSREAPKLVIAAYLDVLGFTALVDLSESHWAAAMEVVRKIDSRLSDAFPEGNQPDAVRRIFSDNLYVSKWLSAEPEEAQQTLESFLLQLGVLQARLAEDGLFVRGGVAIGTEAVTPVILFGTALVKAYEAQLRADVPRIVLNRDYVSSFGKDPTLSLDLLLNSLTQDLRRGERSRIFLKDDDGIEFLDYLACLDIVQSKTTRGTNTKFLEKHRSNILSQLRATSDTRIIDKYLWLSRYHNRHRLKRRLMIDVQGESNRVRKLTGEEGKKLEGELFHATSVLKGLYWGERSPYIGHSSDVPEAEIVRNCFKVADYLGASRVLRDAIVSRVVKAAGVEISPDQAELFRRKIRTLTSRQEHDFGISKELAESVLLVYDVTSKIVHSGGLVTASAVSEFLNLGIHLIREVELGTLFYQAFVRKSIRLDWHSSSLRPTTTKGAAPSST